MWCLTAQVDVDVILMNPIATVPSLTVRLLRRVPVVSLREPYGPQLGGKVDMSSVIVYLSPQLPRAGISTFNVFVVFGVLFVFGERNPPERQEGILITAC